MRTLLKLACEEEVWDLVQVYGDSSLPIDWMVGSLQIEDISLQSQLGNHLKGIEAAFSSVHFCHYI